MQITFNRDRFVETINTLALIVGNDPTFNNSSSNVHVGKPENGTVELTGTDTVASATVRIEYMDVRDFDDPFLLPLAMIRKVLSKCISDTVTFSSKTNTDDIVMNSGNCKLKIKRSSVSLFPLRSYDTSKMTKLVIGTKDLTTGIDKASVAMSVDDTRPEICGVLVEKVSQSIVSIVGANGVQFSGFNVTVDGQDSVEFRGMIPGKYVQIVQKFLSGVSSDAETVDMYLDNCWITISGQNFKFTTTICAKPFPMWQRLFQNTESYQPPVVVDSKLFLETLERVNAINDGRLDSFSVTIDNGEIHMSVLNALAGIHSTDALPAKYTGETITFGCNAFLLERVLKKLDGETVDVAVGWQEGGRENGTFLPIVITDGDFHNLLMPLRGIPSHQA